MPFFVVVHLAVAADPQLADLLAHLDRQRLTGASMVAGSLPTDAAVSRRPGDTIWTMSAPQPFDLPVGQRRRPAPRYRDSAAATLVARPRACPQP